MTTAAERRAERAMRRLIRAAQSVSELVADPLASIIRQAIEAHKRGDFAERDKALAGLRDHGVDLRFATELAQAAEGGQR